jgi:hypothetical protein
MDTSLFLTLFLFWVQTLAQGAAMRWPEHRRLADGIFWSSMLGAVGSLIWYVFSNLDSLLALVDMAGRQAIGISFLILGIVAGVIGLSLIASPPSKAQPDAGTTRKVAVPNENDKPSPVERKPTPPGASVHIAPQKGGYVGTIIFEDSYLGQGMIVEGEGRTDSVTTRRSFVGPRDEKKK